MSVGWDIGIINSNERRLQPSSLFGPDVLVLRRKHDQLDQTSFQQHSILGTLEEVPQQSGVARVWSTAQRKAREGEDDNMESTFPSGLVRKLLE